MRVREKLISYVNWIIRSIRISTVIQVPSGKTLFKEVTSATDHWPKGDRNRKLSMHM